MVFSLVAGSNGRPDRLIEWCSRKKEHDRSVSYDTSIREDETPPPAKNRVCIGGPRLRRETVEEADVALHEVLFSTYCVDRCICFCRHLLLLDEGE